MSSPAQEPSPPSAAAVPSAYSAAPEVVDDGNIEADDNADSAYDGDSSRLSDTTSVTPAIYQGYIQHGRRYEGYNKGKYWAPADDKQFETWSIAHLVMMVMESPQPNPLFRSSLSEKAQRILDIGTGDGSWAVAVADRFPNLTVYGVDLYPPPNDWVPPNCVFEVDDLSKEWTWPVKFDLVHLRWMMGSFTEEQWRTVYSQAYENLEPGGWIEQIELSTKIISDDGSLPADSELANWGQKFESFASKIGRPFDTVNTMRAGIEGAGFINICEQKYKLPLGDWPKNKIYKDAGRLNEEQFRKGMEGFVLSLFTAAGGWSVEECQVYLEKVKRELERGDFHGYCPMKRVWAMKPFDTEVKA